MEQVKKRKGKSQPTQLYLYISAVSFFISIISFILYFKYLKGDVNQRIGQQFFYLLLIVFGISVSALLFGVLKSYASLKGEKLSTTFRFTGPIVGVIITVLGGFYLPKDSSRVVTFRVFDPESNPITKGIVKLYIPNVPQQNVNDNGEAVFANLSEEYLTTKTKVSIACPGYKQIIIDTLLPKNSAIQFTLAKEQKVTLTGRVEDVRERPIKDVEISVEGTRFYTFTSADGTFELELNGFTIGEKVEIITSHSNFEDKSLILPLSATQITMQDLVLVPLE